MSDPDMRRLTRTVSVIGGLAVLIAIKALAQDTVDATWEKEHDRGNRYEGREQIPVGRPELELRSFVGSREKYEEDVELKVRFFLPEALPVSLEAREIRDEKQYLMRAKTVEWEAGRWNTFGPWPTREVLDLEGVAHWNLGLRVEVTRETGRALLPALLFHRQPPDSVERLVAQVLTFSALRRVEYAVFGPGPDGPEKLAGDRLVDEFPAGEPFPVEIDTQDLPQGWLRFELDALYKGRFDGPELDFDFFHQPDLTVE